MMCKLLEKESIDYVTSNVRANNKEDVESEILQVKPTHVMSFIGRTHGIHEGKEFTTIDFLEQKRWLLSISYFLRLLCFCNMYLMKAILLRRLADFEPLR